MSPPRGTSEMPPPSLGETHKWNVSWWPFGNRLWDGMAISVSRHILWWKPQLFQKWVRPFIFASNLKVKKVLEHIKLTRFGEPVLKADVLIVNFRQHSFYNYKYMLLCGSCTNLFIVAFEFSWFTKYTSHIESLQWGYCCFYLYTNGKVLACQ